MTNSLNVKITVNLTDSSLDEEEKEQEVQTLLKQMRDLDELETVNRPIDSSPPSGSKAFASFMVGILTAEFKPTNIKKVFSFLTDRLGNKPIKLKVKRVDGQELEVEASSREEFEFVIQEAERFLTK
jgi:hypothetical protein